MQNGGIKRKSMLITSKSKTAELAQRLVSLYGKPDAMGELLHEDVTWNLYSGKDYPGGVHQGKNEVMALLNFVFGAAYMPESVRTTPHMAFGEGDFGVIRFLLQARSTGGIDYENEYAVVIHTRDDRIAEVWAYTDSLYAVQQFAPPERDDQ